MHRLVTYTKALPINNKLNYNPVSQLSLPHWTHIERNDRKYLYIASWDKCIGLRMATPRDQGLNILAHLWRICPSTQVGMFCQKPSQTRVLPAVKPDYVTFSWNPSQSSGINSFLSFKGCREERTCVFGLESFCKGESHSTDCWFLPYCLLSYSFSLPPSWLPSSFSMIYLMV